MRLSLEWLGDFVEWIETDPRVIAERLTVCSAEVEDIEEQGALLRDCCVGTIVALAKHPNADKLRLVDVATDRGAKRVVCGGSNLREGMHIAFAHVGATVRWHGGELMTLAPVKIRGEASDGMICAAEELELGDRFPATPDDGERAIVDLGRSGITTTGAPLREALGLTDTVLHVSNKAIPHRPDLFSHIGFARECVALKLARWKKTSPKPPAFAKTPVPFDCIVEAPEAISRYSACVLTIDGLGATPEWMVRRLAAAGWRSVSLPVDITNYVATELGMPLHSFDADDIRGDVRFRLTTKGESITTLDNVPRDLPEGAIVLSDDDGIFDLMGVMGGLRSSTKPTTRRIYLHSAIVDPVRIRRTIIATGHRTDAATVYEKGVPRIMAKQGLLRAVELFTQLVPGCTVASALHEWGNDGEAPVIAFRTAYATELLGMDIPAERMREILTDLGCTVANSKDAAWNVSPPLHRLRDLKHERDLVEEVGRIIGFDAVEPRLPAAPVRLLKRDLRLNRLRDAAVAAGFTELLPLSLLGPALLAKAGFVPGHAVAVANPLGEEYSLLAPSVVPKLLEQAQHNIRRCPMLKTFTVSRVFSQPRSEHRECGFLLAEPGASGLLSDVTLHLKQHLCTVVGQIGADIDVQQAASPAHFAHPGRCGDVLAHGRAIGQVCALHPDLCERFDLPASTAVAVLDLTALVAEPETVRFATPLPAYPAVSYDLTLQRSQRDGTAALLQTLRGKHELLEGVDIVDLYDGKPQTPGNFALTLRFTYRAADRTLTEDEAKAAHTLVTASLA